MYGITDGKAVGTYVEHTFHQYLQVKYSYKRGSSASGIDFPELKVDLKVTSIKQPQSSCPFREASGVHPKIGYLTVSNALQWRLQYGRIISLAEEGITKGVENLLD